MLARPERFELPTPWFVARYSIQLSYGRAAAAIRMVSVDLRTPSRGAHPTTFLPGGSQPGPEASPQSASARVLPRGAGANPLESGT